MKASAKHFRAHAPHAHETQTKLKVFRSSTLALNQIGNLDIPFNSLKLIFRCKCQVLAENFSEFDSCNMCYKREKTLPELKGFNHQISN